LANYRQFYLKVKSQGQFLPKFNHL